MTDWLADERIVDRGFAHAWRSRVGDANGEVFFEQLVLDHLDSDRVVLDVGCGHGGFAISLAERCETIVGVDRDGAAIGLARELAAERGVENATFVVAALDGSAALPGEDASVDVFVDRRGPTLDKWLGEACRLAAPKAVIVGMHPTGTAGAVPEWNRELPDQLRLTAFSYEQVRSWVEQPIAESPAVLDSCWWFDVPEWFDDPRELHARLAGRRHPTLPFYAVSATLEQIFARHSGSLGLEIRHCRLVWRVSL
ncbi:MAG: class I SAM-dependent methyltransferase [Acidimicrobiia bacterium]